MKQIFANRIHLILTVFLLWVLFSDIRAGINPDLLTQFDSTKFSGKVFVLAVGINDYSGLNDYGSAGKGSLNYGESDAISFIERVKKDISFREVNDYIFLSKKATRESIKGAFNNISKIAGPNDLFIFYDASKGTEGSILLSDFSTISSVELYSWTQSILTTRQLFYLDVCAGDKVTSQIKKYMMQNPDLSALCKQDRIILSVVGLAYESKLVGGGIFTRAYVDNSTVKIFDIFSESKRTKTEMLYNLYNGDSIIKSIKGTKSLEIEYFSEKEFYQPLMDNDISRTATRPKVKIETNENDSLIKKGETLCLIVGVKDYDFFSPLNNTLNDSKEIRSILSDKYLTKVIYLENPAYKDLYKKLKEIQEAYKFEEGSQFLFYAAAHGGKNELGEGCLLLKDSKTEDGIMQNALKLTSLKRTIGQLGCTNSLILLDICHSGTILDEEACVKPAAIEIPKTSKIYNELFSTNSVAYKNYLNQPSKIFFGSSNDQEAADKGKAFINSPFATVVINFLNENTLPVTDSYYLEASIRNNIMKEKAISNPQFCMYGGCKDDGRFLFFKR